MAVKTKTRKKSSTPSFFKTGLNEKQFLKDMKKAPSSNDQEFLRLFDQDQATVTFVSKINELVEYKSHYLGQGKGPSYAICAEEDGCVYCDRGLRASTRVLCVVYIHRLFKAANGEYEAKRTSNVGYRYFVLNQETAEALVQRAKRRKGSINDRIYIITREGASVDTKFDIERQEAATSKKILNGSPLNAAKKIVQQFNEEQAGARVDDDDDEDEDYDLDEDFEDLDDDDEDETPRRRTKSKKTATVTKKRKVRR